MPRVSLRSDLRVETATQTESVLGSLPVALGVDTQSRKGKPVAVAPTHFAPETYEKIAASVRIVAKEAGKLGAIDDAMISSLDYEPHAGGRPSDYTKKTAKHAFYFALLGLTDERIAEALGIDVTTFIVWKKNKPEFAQALVDGRENTHGLVVNAMFKRAVGFKYPAVKIMPNKNDPENPIYAEYEEYMPPDVGAGKYLLSVWRGKQRKDGWEDVPPEPSPSPAVQININTMDPQEAAKQYRQFIQGEVA